MVVADRCRCEDQRSPRAVEQQTSKPQILCMRCCPHLFIYVIVPEPLFFTTLSHYIILALENMGKGQSGDNGGREAIPVVFVPQDALTSKSLLDVRVLLQENAELNFLSCTISELPSLWPAILEVWPDLGIVPAKKRLTELGCFFQGDPDLAFLKPTNNILLCPLTVIIQIVDFWKLTHGFELSSSFESQLRDVQGFCLGFLTAIAVSCSKNETHFQALASKAIRLAVCIGTLVDLDALGTLDCASAVAVRWKSNAHLQHLQHTMTLYPGVSDTHFECFLQVNLQYN